MQSLRQSFVEIVIAIREYETVLPAVTPRAFTLYITSHLTDLSHGGTRSQLAKTIINPYSIYPS